MLGDVEVQAQFDGNRGPDLSRTSTSDLPRSRWARSSGFPIQLTLTLVARFRPRASFNPYVGGGFGYTFVGFEPDSDVQRTVGQHGRSPGVSRLRAQFGFYGARTAFPPPPTGPATWPGATSTRRTRLGVAPGRRRRAFLQAQVVDVPRRALHRFSVADVSDRLRRRGLSRRPVPAADRLIAGNSTGLDAARAETYGAVPGSPRGTEALTGDGATRQPGLLDGFAGRIAAARRAPTDHSTAARSPTPPLLHETFLPSPTASPSTPGFYYAQGGTLQATTRSPLQVGVRYTFYGAVGIRRFPIPTGPRTRSPCCASSQHAQADLGSA